MTEIAGKVYDFIRGSDVQRDGMYLEVSISNGPQVIEIFYSDKTGKMTVTLLQQDVPLEVLEESIAFARTYLPPTVLSEYPAQS
jgi:hypothetical protein